LKTNPHFSQAAGSILNLWGGRTLRRTWLRCSVISFKGRSSLAERSVGLSLSRSSNSLIRWRVVLETNWEFLCRGRNETVGKAVHGFSTTVYKKRGFCKPDESLVFSKSSQFGGPSMARYESVLHYSQNKKGTGRKGPIQKEH
jgi:hypothetical protein